MCPTLFIEHISAWTKLNLVDEKFIPNRGDNFRLGTPEMLCLTSSRDDFVKVCLLQTRFSLSFTPHVLQIMG
jgi:hypothetical protein